MSSIKILHISDLHFGTKNQQAVWKSLSAHIHDIRPDLIVVTGDIVDSPHKKAYEGARDALDQLRINKWWVCAGNHDRHPFGNARFGRLWRFEWAKRMFNGDAGSSTWFDGCFSGKILLPDQAHEVTLTSGQNTWRLALLGLDTSRDARYFAQGFVDPGSLAKLAKSASSVGADFDLCILAGHHHLLPIAKLESESQTLGESAVAATTVMRNAGTLLNTLSAHNVNLVLHGHEHQHFAARYGTIGDNSGDVAVVAAGSAVGLHTLEGCEFKRSSFNVIELLDDRRVILHEHRFTDGAWSSKGGGVQLFNAADIRRFQARRSRSIVETPTSQITKTFDFNPSRDVFVREVRTEWVVKPGSTTQTVFNSTGFPDCEGVEIEWDDGSSDRFCPKYEPAMAEHTHELKIPLALTKNRKARRFIIDTSWVSGGLLTTDDFLLVPRHRRGRLRNEDREFATAVVDAPLESLTIVVSLPPQFVPAVADLTIVAEPAANVAEGPPERQPELVKGLRIQDLGQGRFLLRVPYPAMGARYGLAWRPVQATRPMSGQRLRELVPEPRGQAVLTAWMEGLTDELKAGPLSVSLYGATSAQEALCWVKLAALPNQAAELDVPPMQIAVSGAEGIYTDCWWGKTIMMRAGERGAQLLQGEVACLAIPVMPPPDGPQPPPLLMVRIGYGTLREIIEDSESATTVRAFQALEQAAILLLNGYIRSTRR
ncbi:putative phosphodiesterase [Paraburkholderia sp. RAU6.4a]|uniref:metallophosphoesterase family protein n=1 Tax=Paraburkholderia sp. RAU6.4a TaxID=2991067 RepID=UPI003D1BBA71